LEESQVQLFEKLLGSGLFLQCFHIVASQKQVNDVRSMNITPVSDL